MGVYKKNGNWFIDFYCGSKRIRRMIGPSKRLAETALKDAQIKVAKGHYLGIYEDKKITLKDFSGEYLVHMRKRLEPWNFRRCNDIVEQHLIPYFTEYLSKISIKDVEGYKTIRLDKVKPATVNREVTRLKHIFNTAVEWKYVSKNPIEGLKALKEPPGRVRYLDDDELRLLLDAINGHWLEPLVLISLNMGLRRSELLGLGWSKNIDLKNGQITLFKTKTNKRRAIAINNTVYEVLRKIPRRIDNDLLFPDYKGDMVSMAFKRLCLKIGIGDFHWHDLRHCFASYLTMNNYNLKTVQELLGHSDTRTTERYSHLSPAHLQNAVNTLDSLFKRERSSSLGQLIK
jgi:integrase